MPRGRPKKIIPGGEVNSSKESARGLNALPNSIPTKEEKEEYLRNTLDGNQAIAINRIYTIAEGHFKEKYIDPAKCEVLAKVKALCEEYFKKKGKYPYTFKFDK